MGAEQTRQPPPEEVLPHAEQAEQDGNAQSQTSFPRCGADFRCGGLKRQDSGTVGEEEPHVDVVAGESFRGNVDSPASSMEISHIPSIRSTRTSVIIVDPSHRSRDVDSPESSMLMSSRSSMLRTRASVTIADPSHNSRGKKASLLLPRRATQILEQVGILDVQPELPPTSPRRPVDVMELSRQHSLEYWANRVEYLEREERVQVSLDGMEALDKAAQAWSLPVERKNKRHARRELLIIGTMDRAPSQRLQIVIENMRDLREFYDVDKEVLGKGSFGSVMKCGVKASGATRAVKMVAKKAIKETIVLLKREISITKMTDHPNIVKLYEIFEDRTFLYFVMELCSGGTLQDRLQKRGRLSERGAGGAAVVMRQVFRGVYYLHKFGIIHRDLKPENFLLTVPQHGDINNLQGCIRIADFGISCLFKPGQVQTSLAGTFIYMAPEVIEKHYDERCDIWSCGVILYECLCGYPPFSGPDSAALCKAVKAGKLRFNAEDWADVSQVSTELVRELLRKDYTKRIHAEQTLKHRWLLLNLPAKPSTEPLSLPLIESLRAFRSLNKFKRAALHVIASLLREDQVAISREAFDALDVDGDGSLEVGELCLALQRSHPHLVKEVTEIFEDGRWGVVAFSYTEFIAATFQLKDFDAKICMAAFQTFDHSGDGIITMEEIRSGSVLGDLKDDDLAQLVREFDLDGDGKIDFDEFRDMLSSSLGSDLVKATPKLAGTSPEPVSRAPSSAVSSGDRTPPRRQSQGGAGCPVEIATPAPVRRRGDESSAQAPAPAGETAKAKKQPRSSGNRSPAQTAAVATQASPHGPTRRRSTDRGVPGAVQSRTRTVRGH